MGTAKMETAAEKYKGQIANREAVVVDVKLPSGFVFKFEKPSRFAMLFRAGQLPQAAASDAVAAWQELGLIDDEQVTEQEIKQIDLANTMLSLRNRVLELSREPKLVVGLAMRPNELSTDDVADEDLEYLFKWVSAGGDASVMLAMFPKGPGQDVMASASRKTQRHKAKSNGGA